MREAGSSSVEVDPTGRTTEAPESKHPTRRVWLGTQATTVLGVASFVGALHALNHGFFLGSRWV